MTLQRAFPFFIGFNADGEFYKTTPRSSLNSETVKASFDDSLIICGNAWRDIECAGLLGGFLTDVLINGSVDTDTFIEDAFEVVGANGKPGKVIWRIGQ